MRPKFLTSLVTALSLATVAACGPSSEAAESSANGTSKAPTASANRTLNAGRQFSMAMTQTISSRSAKPGDAFTASVVADVEDAAGRVAIPSGSVVSGTITDVKSATDPNSSGTLTLAVNSVSVRGKSYDIDASIDALATERAARNVSGSDAVKVGVGAAAGAIVGQIIGKNTKGTVIGAVVGAAAGAGYAVATKDSDIRLPAGTHVLLTLNQRLSVSGS